MSIRLRRLTGDYKRVVDELSGNPYMKVRPVKGNPPEKYSVTYYVPGLFWNEAANNLERRDAWVCIGDYWAAGETLVDVLVQIGDMIQYKVYNSKSPLNAVAARWATENSHLLPVGNVDLLMPDIDLDIVLMPAGSLETDGLDITLL